MRQKASTNDVQAGSEARASNAHAGTAILDLHVSRYLFMYDQGARTDKLSSVQLNDITTEQKAWCRSRLYY